MFRTKYNSTQLTLSNPLYNNNNIEKYLKEEIDFLLAPSVNQLSGIDPHDVYIPNSNAEYFLSSALKHSRTDKILFLTGLTGSGKTMILKEVFKYKSLAPQIQEKTLLIPFSFDNFSDGTIVRHEDSIEFLNRQFCNMLNSVCELIENSIPDLKKAEENESDFFKFICRCRGEFSQTFSVWPRPPISQRLQSCLNENPLPFYLLMLKFYLNQAPCFIDNIVFLLDDIEGIGEKNELAPIQIAFRILTCMQNLPTPANRTWSINLVIGCRNYVFRLIKEKNLLERQQLETYTESEEYHLDTTPTITEIVNKRYETVIKKDKGKKWLTALEIVLAIINKIDSSIGDFLLNLKIRNMRKALSAAKRVVYNKRWIQRDYIENTNGAFTINSVEDYDITFATLIRAIGMGESNIYDSSISNIPNIMCNENNMDLYPLLVIKYCLNMRSHKYSTWGDTIDVSDFYNYTNNIFGKYGPQHNEMFKRATEYLIMSRLLLRSIDQLQDNAMPVNETNVSDIRKIYISNAAVDIWDLLGKNSILFEMYTDDLWLDNTNRSGTKRTYRGFDIDNFRMALDYAKYLVDREIIIRNHASNLGNIDKYTELFGSDFVTMHLLNGLMNSLRAFYKDEAIQQNEFIEIYELQEKIREEMIKYPFKTIT